MKVKPTSIGFNFRCATYKKFSWGGGGGGVSSVCLVKFRNLLQTLLIGHPVLSKHKPGSRGTCPAEHRFHLVN